MITRTALTSSRFLAQIKRAVKLAVWHAHQTAHGFGGATVRNRKGRPSLVVRAECGGSLVFIDKTGRNITALVLQALRAWHRGLESVQG